MGEGTGKTFELEHNRGLDSFSSPGIGLMFWGARVELDNACAAIRGWVTATFG